MKDEPSTRLNFSPEPGSPAAPRVEELVEGQAWALRGVFSNEECKSLINESERLGMSPIGCATNYRVSDRLEIDSAELAQVMYERVAAAGVLPSSISVASDGTALGSTEALGFGIEGQWMRAGLNDHMRFCKYNPGGFFLAHRDSHYMPSSDRRSFFTCMLYLNGGFEGGCTNFLDESRHSLVVHEGMAAQSTGAGDAEEVRGTWKLAAPESITHSVAPEAGLVLVFFHPMLHEGALLHTGVKYIARTEVMYERAIDSAPALSDTDREAVAMFELACAAESQGRREEAIALYKKVARLSAKVADHYGL